MRHYVNILISYYLCTLSRDKTFASRPFAAPSQAARSTCSTPLIVITHLELHQLIGPLRPIHQIQVADLLDPVPQHGIKV